MGRLNDLSLATQVAVFGNKRAFDQLVREYQSPVRRFLLSQTAGNEALSDDLAQETFIKAYTHISQYRGTSSFLTWLTRIAYNVWYDYKRTPYPQPLPLGMGEDRSSSDNQVLQKTHYVLGLQGNYSSPSQGGGGGEPLVAGLSIDLQTALGILKEEERTCVTLQLIEGYAIDDIARITAMPANTVKSHLKRGKEKLANYLRQNGYDR